MKKINPFSFNYLIQVSPSKSYAQRALLASLFATEHATIRNLGESADALAMLDCLKEFGAEILVQDDAVTVYPSKKQIPFPLKLNVGESGLALRMLGSAALAFSNQVELIGSGTLNSRNQNHLIEVLEKLGLEVNSNGKIPILVNGSVNNVQLEIDASSGSQVLSGLCFLFAFCEKSSCIKVKNLKSRPYLEMTVELLNHLGAFIDFDGERLVFNPATKPKLFDYQVEADWSGAANFVVGALLSGKVQLQGLNLNSLQSDRKILEIARQVGGKIEEKYNGLFVEKHKLSHFKTDLTDAPDLFPIVAILAAGISGESLLIGTNRLLNKESNRLESICEMLKVLSVEFETGDNCLLILGKPKFEGGLIKTFHDHRIAMAATIAATCSVEAIVLDDENCVSKSYPQFFEHLQL